MKESVGTKFKLSLKLINIRKQINYLGIDEIGVKKGDIFMMWDCENIITTNRHVKNNNVTSYIYIY